MPDNKVVFRPLRDVCYLTVGAAAGALLAVALACVLFGWREVLAALWR